MHILQNVADGHFLLNMFYYKFVNAFSQFVDGSDFAAS